MGHFPVPTTLSGIELRFVLCVYLLDARRTVTVSELVAHVEGLGVPLAGRTSKLISDALRWEVPKGRVRRVGRSRYAAGRMPRSTEWWIRTRAAAAIARLSLQQPAA